MTQRAYHHGSLGPALIAAGLEAAREGGPSALTIRDLARRAGVSPAAAYRHFPDLDHLVAEVSRMARQELAQAMIAAREALPKHRDRKNRAWVAFAAIGDAYVRFAVSSPRLFEAAFVACAAPPAAPEHPSAWEVLTDSITELVAAGAIAASRQAEAPLIAWAAVHGLGSILVGKSVHAPIDVDAAITSTLAAVRRSLV
ncbi:MAG: TetR/AcrR family transcriptional regulator [Actinomycetota bacterium]